MIEINVNDRCTGCGICVKKCPTDVFQMIDKKSIPSNAEECMACRLCEVVCPMKGIAVIEK